MLAKMKSFLIRNWWILLQYGKENWGINAIHILLKVVIATTDQGAASFS